MLGHALAAYCCINISERATSATVVSSDFPSILISGEQR